ncbi:C40 family peptidase [Micromonospora sp. CPCC 205371]|nr:C40 family peptidase [Micromonospora sp. CPCC 205371]
MAAPAPAAPATVTTVVAAQAAEPVNVAIKLTASSSKVAWGSAVTLTARVNDPNTGAPVTGGGVQFQAWRNGGWKTWQTKAVTNGTATYRTTPYVSGSFRLKYTSLPGKYRWTASSSIRVNVVASRAKVLAEARKHVGKSYRYGASGPGSFDCSGYTMYVYRAAAGIKLPHKANSQQRYGKAVAKSSAQPGDLIVIRSGSYGYHVGVYAGGGYMYDSPKPGVKVGKHKIWTSSYVVRRLVG